MATDLMELLANEPVQEFRPYWDLSPEADALTFYFRPDADYSKRLTDHVTLYLSLDTHEVIGCRIKGIRGILDDLPNYVEVKHGGMKLKLLFFSFRGCVSSEEERNAINALAKGAGDMTLAR